MYKESLENKIRYKIESNIDVSSIMDALEILPKTTLEELTNSITKDVMNTIEKHLKEDFKTIISGIKRLK